MILEFNSYQLNVAGVVQSTRALGPGLRSVLYLRGCNLHCPSCLVPEWWDFEPTNLLSLQKVQSLLLANPSISGVTFSGGEPFLQAAPLAALAKKLRLERDLSLIAFSGFTIEQLLTHPPSPGVSDLLDAIDLLIDGPYISSLDNGLGLRGSTNQRFHFLSSRLASYDFASSPRTVELHLLDGSFFASGIPSAPIKSALLEPSPNFIFPEAPDVRF
jgi:anaerobic ribonucleoside-triphosphate reductase activating protein